MGTDATMSAAILDGTHCSAQTTPPLPPINSRAPTIAATRHSARVGHGTPRACDQSASTTPATRKRMPAMRNGGIVSIAKRMARYVEPQMR